MPVVCPGCSAVAGCLPDVCGPVCSHPRCLNLFTYPSVETVGCRDSVGFLGVGLVAGIDVFRLNESVFCVAVLIFSFVCKGFLMCGFCFLCFLSHKLTF